MKNVGTHLKKGLEPGGEAIMWLWLVYPVVHTVLLVRCSVLLNWLRDVSGDILTSMSGASTELVILSGCCMVAWTPLVVVIVLLTLCMLARIMRSLLFLICVMILLVWI